MSIATQLQRIKDAKEALKVAINAKGGTLTDETLDAYAEAVTLLPSGGGGGSSDGYVAVEVDGVLKAQKLAFDGTTASPDGSAEEIGSVGIFNTGKDEPAYKGMGGGAFYKCASVDSTTKTWTGYEAIVNGDTGVWSFSETLTEDLPYNKLIPQVGKVYDEECTFMVSGFDSGSLIPEEGLVFYAPLSQDYKDTVNGLEPTQTTGGFTEYNGKTCLKGPTEDESGAGIIWNNTVIANFISGSAPFSVFLCAAWSPTLAGGWKTLFCLGDYQPEDPRVLIVGQDASFEFKAGNISYYSESGDIPSCESSSSWGSFCFTRDVDGNVNVYYSGASIMTGTDNTGTVSGTKLSLLSDTTNSNAAHNAYISDCCIYNRALTTEEVLSMHNNLMPQ